MNEKGHYGVDLDGTLAFYDHYRGPTHIGPPVPRMLQRVRHWLRRGKEVWVFTARVHPSKPDADEARAAIEAWCERHVGRTLPVTCEKDPDMVEFWDDRARRVRKNTGLEEALGRQLANQLLEIAEIPSVDPTQRDHRMTCVGRSPEGLLFSFVDNRDYVIALSDKFIGSEMDFQLTSATKLVWSWSEESGHATIVAAAVDRILYLDLDSQNKLKDYHIVPIKK